MTQKFSKMMSTNSNKRKGRMSTNSNKLGRSKLYSDKNMACDGIYGNLKVMYAAASLVGCVVQVQVQNGTIWEGVLHTFSHQLDIVLEMAHKVESDRPPVKGVSSAVSNLIASFPFERGFFEKLVFKFSDVVILRACGVDTDYAVKDNFTDTAISKFNGQIKERELEPWEGAGSDSETSLGVNIEDDDGTVSNGWDANDMFRTNAEKYGVKSSYDNSLHDYTVPLTKKDTEEYKLQEAKATKIAHEIEATSAYQSRIQMENGDEEDRFSAVVRMDDSTSSKYVLPQKRKNVPPKRVQTTPSPVHVTGSKPPPPYSSPLQETSMMPPLGQVPKPFPATSPLLERPSSPLPYVSNSPTQISTPVPTATSSVPKNGVVKTLVGDEMAGTEISNTSTNVETNVPLLPAPSKMQVLCPQSLAPRIERRRENEKKMSKQKGRTDEIEEFKKFSTHFKLTEENKESCHPEEAFPDTSLLDPLTLTNKIERVKISKEEEKASDVLKYSNLNPNAKEFVFNPNAKSFIPRSMPPVVPTPQPPISTQQQMPQQHSQPQRLQDQQQQQSGPVMAVPHSQMMHSQPLFTAMAAHPQYVMQAPVSMAITSPFASHQMQQTPRFRKVPITMQHRHDFTPSMHVAAATGQPILAQAAIPTPSQLTMQYTSPPGHVLHHHHHHHASAPPQQTVGYHPQMNFVVGPRVVSPQPVGMIPSPSVSYCDTSHLPAHLLISAAHHGASHSASSTPHSLSQGQHSNHHPPQSQTPVLHPAPSPVHQVPNHHGNLSQPPTPTAVMYPGGGALSQHPLQAAGHHHHHSHSQPMSHPMHQHHPGFPTGPQPVVLMQQQQAAHHGGGHQGSAQHHPIHMHALHPQNPGGHATHILPQMTIIPTSAAAMTSAPTSIATPPYVQQHQ